MNDNHQHEKIFNVVKGKHYQLIILLSKDSTHCYVLNCGKSFYNLREFTFHINQHVSYLNIFTVTII